MRDFWTYTIWYLILGVTIIIELIYLFAKTNTKKETLQTIIAVIGLTFIFEILVATVFDAYEYYPKIFPKHWNHFLVPNPMFYEHQEKIIGNFFSQFSVSTTAVVLAERKMKLRWHVFAIVIYAIIEELFKYLGIYKQNWYKTWMTMIALAILFGLTKLIYSKCLKGNGPFLIFIYILLAVNFTTVFTGPGWITYSLGVQTYIVEWLDKDMLANIVIIYTLIMFVQTSIILIAYYFRLKWQGHAVVVGILLFQHYLLFKFNVNLVEYWWLTIVFPVTWILSLYLHVFFLIKLYGNKTFKYHRFMINS